MLRLRSSGNVTESFMPLYAEASIQGGKGEGATAPASIENAGVSTFPEK